MVGLQEVRGVGVSHSLLQDRQTDYVQAAGAHISPAACHKTDMSLSSDAPRSTCSEASSEVVSLLKSASIRSSGRSSSFSSIVMDRMSKARGHSQA